MGVDKRECGSDNLDMLLEPLAQSWPVYLCFQMNIVDIGDFFVASEGTFSVVKFFGDI